MSVGFPIDKSTLDQKAGSLTLQLRETFNRVQTMKTWLDSKTDTELKAAPYGYTQAEVDLLKASFTDLDNLRKVATGQQTQPGANNFFFNAGKLTGVE